MGEAKSGKLLGLTTRWVSRILAAAVGLLLPVLPAEIHAVETPAAGATYAYDGHHHTAPTFTTQERGSPGTCATADGAAGRWSHGASARPEGAITPLAYTYNAPMHLVQVASLASTTQRPAESTPAEPSTLERSQVAAESGGFDLAAAEEAGGHTIARHVGMSDQALIDRNIPYASTFMDQAAGVSATAQNISTNAGAITKWLAGSSPRLAIQDSMDSALGRVYERATQSFLQPSSVNTVLVRTPSGYNVLTSYPTP
jgi:hypothetical protein